MSTYNNFSSSCFSTGKFAEICNTTKNTLFHYDEIGLLKPSIIKDNGYRYYSVDQIYTFDIINILKNCNCSLKEIKETIENSDISTFFDFVNEKKAELLLQQQKINKAINLLEHSSTITSFALDGQMNIPYITKTKENKYIVATPCDATHTQNSNELAKTLNKHFTMCENIQNIEKFPLGHIILQQTFNCGELNHAYIYSILNEPLKEQLATKNIKTTKNKETTKEITPIKSYNNYQKTIKKGSYLNIKHQGPYETIGNAYQQLFSYIYTNQLTLDSDIYEENLISHFATSKETDHVIHIFVKIKE